MKTVSVSEAKNSLSALLQDVRGGASILITDRGVPVAQLGPLGTSTGVPPGAISLAQQGRLVLPAHAPRAKWRDLPMPAVDVSGRAVSALIAEREESR